MSDETLDSRISPAVAARLTADGRGAIAVVRVWGPESRRIADATFRPTRGRVLGESAPGRPRLGRIGSGLGDEVVAFVTADDPPEVEIQCHGGPAAVEMVLEALHGAGAEVVEAPRWLARRGTARVTFEAAVDLAHAPTVAAAEILRDQADGALEGEIRRAWQLVEADPDEAIRRLDALLDRATIGLRLIDGWRVVLAGRPNVGKSRLLNALAGYERAIVDATPGTTRDVVTVRTAIAGWPVELSDTAGLRVAGDPIEAAGVALARARQASADLVLLVLDGSEPLGAEDREFLVAFPAALRVASKADLPDAWDADALAARRVSAARGDGLESLVREIGHRIVPAEPPPGIGVPFRDEHARLLRRARHLLSGERPGTARRALGRLLTPCSDGRTGE